MSNPDPILNYATTPKAPWLLPWPVRLLFALIAIPCLVIGVLFTVASIEDSLFGTWESVIGALIFLTIGAAFARLAGIRARR